MKIVLTEKQFERFVLSEYAKDMTPTDNDYNPIADGNVEHNPYAKQIKAQNKAIASFLQNNGRLMTNIDNGKDYIAFELTALGELTGKRSVMCQLIKDNKPFGSIYVKPFTLFRYKTR